MPLFTWLLWIGLAAQAPTTPAQPATQPLVFAQNEKLPPTFRQVEAKREDGSVARIYLHHPEPPSGTPRPLLVYIEGSGAQSLFYEMESGAIGSGLLTLIAEQAQAGFHVASMDKRGVAFGEMGQYGAGQGASEEYTHHATLKSRAADVRLLLSTLLADERFDPGRVVLLGHSEGADVAAAVAATDERVTHVAFLAGGGTEQFFDMFLLTRKEMARQGASPEEVEAEIEVLEKDIRRILDDPGSKTEFWQGHAYKRWSTFATTAAADNLLKTEAAIFLAHGSEDTSVPIESFDYLVVKLLCAGKMGVTVFRYPSRDHSFNATDAQPGSDGILDITAQVLDWALLTD